MTPLQMWLVFSLSCIISVHTLAKKRQKGNAKHPEKTPEEIKKIFEENEIIPDVIDTPPPHVLKVGYTKAGVVVDFGNNITREQSREAPTSLEWPAEQSTYHTLIMIDPDFPSRKERKKERQWHHWLVVNIPGHNLLKATTLSEYIPVEAKNNTGQHRYVFLVYKQPHGDMEFEEIHTIAVPVDSLRAPFSCREYAAKYKLTGPIAGNFFLSQFGRLWPLEEVDPKYARKKLMEKQYKTKGYKAKKKKKPGAI